MKRLLFVMLILLSLSGLSQTSGLFSGLDRGRVLVFTDDSVRTVAGWKRLTPAMEKPKFDFVLDARRTFISDVPARLFGLRFGVEYRRVHRFGLGLYDSGSKVHVDSFSDMDIPMDEASVKLNYGSFFYERVLYFHPKWEWSATLHLGNGTLEGEYRPRGMNVWLPLDVRRVRISEISTTCYYNLTWWCNIGVGAGYRQVSGLQKELRGVYSAPVAIARVRVRLGKLVKSIWNRDIKYEY